MWKLVARLLARAWRSRLRGDVEILPRTRDMPCRAGAHLGLRRCHDSHGDIVWQAGPGKKAAASGAARGFAQSHDAAERDLQPRILELSANIAGAERLADADGTATAHSKLCGSTVTVDLKLEGDRVTAFGQTVKACLLGQAAASVMGRNIVGSSARELREVGSAMRRMLKEGGPPPTGPLGRPRRAASPSRTTRRGTPRRCWCSTPSRRRWPRPRPSRAAGGGAQA